MNSIKIIFDGRMIDKQLHGIGRYAYEIIKGMLGKKNIILKVIVNDKDLAQDIFKNENIDFIEIKSKFLSFKEIFEIPKNINRYDGYIYFSPSFSSSPFIKLKSYITIHDLNHIKLNKYYSKVHLLYYKFVVKPFAKKCEKIFTVSHFAKKEIVDWLECNSDKVVVTYNGIDSKFGIKKEIEKLNEIKVKYKLPENFILYVGNKKPHKNVETLLKAMKFLDNVLVLSGSENESLCEIMRNNNLQNKVKFIGYIKDDDLPYIYNLAECFIFPSVYEGFGLPPLEAVCCGCSVVVSDISVFKEILKDNVYRFDKYNVDDLVMKIKLALKNKKYVDIKELKRKFNWSNTVNETISNL